jgi:hypothetical protein
VYRRTLFWVVAGALYFSAAYQILWTQWGPFADGSGVTPGVELPGYSPPLASNQEFREDEGIQTAYRLPYLVYAFAMTAVTGVSLFAAKRNGGGVIRAMAYAALALPAPTVAHWLACQFLPASAVGCFSWGDPVHLLLYFTPVAAPLALLAGVAEKLSANTR